MSQAKLEILTPRAKFYEGQVESLVVDTLTGSDGYLPGHVWCCNLLKEDGKVQFREPDRTEMRTVNVQGGFVEIREVFTIYTEDASWISGDPNEEDDFFQ